MSFEDFKKHWELFTKIDTEEKLAICRKHYEEHRLYREDQAFFEPSDVFDNHNSPDQYKRNLYAIFELDRIASNQIYCLTVPSFEPENLLIIEKLSGHYLLTHYLLLEQYWPIYYNNYRKDMKNMSKSVKTLTLDEQAGDRLFMLLEESINEASLPRAKGLVLDGVMYFLIKITEGKPKTVFKHSPGEHTRTGKIITLMEAIIKNVRSQNNESTATIETL